MDHLTGEALDTGNEFPGERGDSKTESGFYDKGLKKAMEIPEDSSELSWAVQRSEVKIVGHGHCHSE